MKKRAFWALAAVLVAAVSAGASPFNETVKRSPMQQAHHEIAILNLVNGLEMDAKQQHALLDLAEKAKAMRAEYRQREAALASEATPAYRALEAQLLQGHPADSATEKRAQEVKNRQRELELQYDKDLAALVENVKQMMSPGQLDIIKNYSSCLIPPKDLRDPSRVGQANDGSQIEHVMERIRKAPPAFQSAGIDKFLERHTEEIRRLYPDGNLEAEAAERARVRALFEKACRMNDADFALNRAQLADEIYKPYADFKAAHRAKNPWFNVEHFLLDDATPDLLQKRLAKASGH